MPLHLIAIPRSEYRSADRLRAERGDVVLANRTHISDGKDRKDGWGKALCGTAVPAGGTEVPYPERPDRERWLWRLTCKKCRTALARMAGA